MADTIYESQEIIFTKGDPSDFAYVLKAGQVEILKDYPETPFRLALLNDGEIFGEMGLVDERPRSLTARAVGETRVSKISRNEFVDLIINRPQESFRYLRMFFERLRAMNMKLTHAPHEDPPAISDKTTDFKVILLPESPATASVVASEGIEITRFPFRIGRRSTRREDPLEVNDLVLPDARPFNVSRNHFAIEKNNDGIMIHDRGSYLGTIINGQTIGGHHRGAWKTLNSGENEIIVGSQHSPFRFQIILSEI